VRNIKPGEKDENILPPVLILEEHPLKKGEKPSGKKLPAGTPPWFVNNWLKR